MLVQQNNIIVPDNNIILPNSDIITPISNITKDEDLLLKEIQKGSSNVKLDDYRAIEIIRCRQNPLYFILNYVYLPEVGGSMKYDESKFHPKLRRFIRCAMKYHRVIFTASRQLGKSSIAACLFAWAILFYPGTRVVILNFSKSAAQENLKKIRYIIDNCPPWLMRGNDPFTSRTEIKSYFEMKNGSRVETFYPSSTMSPDTLARSLTVPINFSRFQKQF